MTSVHPPCNTLGLTSAHTLTPTQSNIHCDTCPHMLNEGHTHAHTPNYANHQPPSPYQSLMYKHITPDAQNPGPKTVQAATSAAACCPGKALQLANRNQHSIPIGHRQVEPGLRKHNPGWTCEPQSRMGDDDIQGDTVSLRVSDSFQAPTVLPHHMQHRYGVAGGCTPNTQP
jgi:hypothetical protein